MLVGNTYVLYQTQPGCIATLPLTMPKMYALVDVNKRNSNYYGLFRTYMYKVVHILVK